MGNVTTTTTAWVTELQDALGADSVLLDPDVTAAYARDQAMLAPAGTPAAVVFPRSTAEVVAVMQVAAPARGADRAARRRVRPDRRRQRRRRRGHASCMTRMNRILEIDEGNRLAVVQPGVVNLALPHARSSPAGCSTRRTRRPTTGARSAATCPPTPAACAA